MKLVELFEAKTIDLEWDSGITTTVWMNPTHSDIKSLIKTFDMRGAVYGEKIFVWNAYDAIHYTMEEQLIEYGYLDESDYNRGLSFILSDSAYWDEDEYEGWEGVPEERNGLYWLANGSLSNHTRFQKMLGPIRECAGVGRVVDGVNTTVDIGTNEIVKQAAKLGFTVDPDGVPPLISKEIRYPKQKGRKYKKPKAHVKENVLYEFYDDEDDYENTMEKFWVHPSTRTIHFVEDGQEGKPEHFDDLPAIENDDPFIEGWVRAGYSTYDNNYYMEARTGKELLAAFRLLDRELSYAFDELSYDVHEPRKSGSLTAEMAYKKRDII